MTMTDREGQAAVMVDLVEELFTRYPPLKTEPRDFLAAQFDLGLAFVDLAPGLGGIGADASLQTLVDDRLLAAGAPSPLRLNPIGVGMGVPTIRQHGSLNHLRRYLRGCFTGEQIWCQLFSEPGSGSDVAALSTGAIRDGDHWIISGQKVWTSLAHVASVGMLLARTNPDRPKHRGLTYFLIDMQAPGVETRPLRQMTGDAEFNEVFLTDVRVPDDNRVGGIGEGWSVALTTLMNERVLLSGAANGIRSVGGTSIERLIAAARANGRWEDAVMRDELVRRYVEGRVIRMTNQRARARRGAGRPGSEGSITKLFQCIYNRRVQDTALRVVGVPATAWDIGDESAWSTVRGFLRAQANTIEGGTSDIQRNVLGERILGLPKESGPSPDTRWSDLRRNG
jgi:alkylation response protein AidB-like acyl-CoA dehydrogenase